MKALSLWEPWASLICLGYKRFETRSWNTQFRGVLVIHAAKRTDDLEYWFNQPFFREAFEQAGIKSFVDLPLSKALCTANLIGTFRTEMIRDRLSRRERAFGNYEDGRWAFELADVKPFRSPLTMRGAQGLFDCNISIPALYQEAGKDSRTVSDDGG